MELRIFFQKYTDATDGSESAEKAASHAVNIAKVEELNCMLFMQFLLNMQ
jgi:hypothetical protein